MYQYKILKELVEEEVKHTQRQIKFDKVEKSNKKAQERLIELNKLIDELS